MQKIQKKRRNLLRSLTLGAGSLTLSQIPHSWIKPVVQAVILPAHAQTSDDVVSPEIDIRGGDGTPISIPNGSTTPNPGNNTDLGIATNGSSSQFFIFNTGTADLTFTGTPLVEITGEGWSLVTPPVNPISPGNDDFFSIQFTNPMTVSGPFPGTVSIANNDSDENPYTFAVLATVP